MLQKNATVNGWIIAPGRKGVTDVWVYGCTYGYGYGYGCRVTGDGAHRAVETKHHIKHQTSQHLASCEHVELENNQLDRGWRLDASIPIKVDESSRPQISGN
jgi:hypothetical protein